MDEHTQLITNSPLSVAVLGAGEDYVLIRLDADGYPIDEASVEEAKGRGFDYCGLLAIKDGRAGVRIVEGNPGAIYTMLFAGLAFAHLVADRPQSPPTGDAEDWLSRLFGLPDTRTT